MSGNGVDIAAVYQLLSRVAETVTTLVDTVNGHSRRLDAIEHDIRDLREGQKSLREGQESMRKDLAFYHASVMGHGITITDLEHRVRRIEDHLHLPPVS